ncbi:MAG: 6-pyruvoyl-tetrahydropterin synthase-related protein [Candidatus Daviesbacteria bacterium]
MGTKFKKNIWFITGLLLTLSLLWPLFVAPYFSHHDDVQTIRLYEMDKCIKDGQIPCRWVPDLGGLYGYPIFNYYAPFPYYFGELIYLVSQSLILSAKFIFLIPFVGAYVFMFLLGKKLWGNLGGAISGIFYSFAPYHAVVFYVRGAMGELWSLMFFPAIFWALLRLKDQQNLLNVLVTSLLTSLLVLSHNISTMLFLPMVLLFILIIFITQKKLIFLKLSLVSIFFGFLLSAFYWLPMIGEKNLVHVETTTYGYFSYTEHFKGLRKLFLERTWGWGASVREVPGGEKDGMSFQIGWVHILGLLLSIAAIPLLWKKSREKSLIIILAISLTAFSIFMVNPRSELIWKLFEPLKFIQFPWRFLMFIIFFISLISGSIVFLNTKIKILLSILLIVLVVALNFSYFRPEKFIQINDRELLQGQNWDSQIKRSIFDFLPIFAKAPPAELATVRYEVLNGKAIISDFKEGTNWISFETNSEQNSVIRLSQYYFPDWKVFIDGKETKINYDNDLGLITFNVSPGIHQIEARLYDTSIRLLANIISALGIILFILLLAYPKFMKRK